MVSSSKSGSSPPARGTPYKQRMVMLSRRFIPARAGNTLPAPARPFLIPVHPRPRGEHIRYNPVGTQLDGSSPPARGTHFGGVAVAIESRFIPARAGNTESHETYRRPPAVHPRPRGEHASSYVFPMSVPGSSPPARGTRLRRQCAPLSVRFIPARAGNTPTGPVTASHIPVHPRPRGEHYSTHALSGTVAGSSPPARGTHGAAPRTRLPDRFIPARAGNTAKR